jgi:hypothetical protein
MEKNQINQIIKKKINPEMIFGSNNYIKKTYSVKTEINNNYLKIRNTLNYYGNLPIGLIYNPVVIISLHDSIEYEEYNSNDLNNIFDAINLQITGYDIDEQYESDEINILQKYHGLEIKFIGNKIYFPLPFDLLINGFSPIFGGGDSIVFLFKTRKTNPILNMIKNIELNLDLLVGQINLDFNYSKQIKNCYLENYNSNNDINDVNDVDNIKNNDEHIDRKKFLDVIKDENTIIIGHSYGSKILINEELKLKKSKLLKNILPRISNVIYELFFYFTDDNIKKILDIKIFDYVELQINSQIYWKRTYEELKFDLEFSEKKNIYFRIPFEQITSKFEFDNCSEFTFCIYINEKINETIQKFNIQSISLKIFCLYRFNMFYLIDKNKRKFFSTDNFYPYVGGLGNFYY